MKAKLAKLMLVGGLALLTPTLVGCDDDDWEDFFDELQEFVDDYDHHHDSDEFGFWVDWWD